MIFPMPGATPQSVTTVTLCFFARSSSWNGSSGKNDMSTMFFPASITVVAVCNPKKPGTAPTTISNGRIASASAARFEKSSCLTATLWFLRADNASALMSTAVTSKFFARSIAIALPTRPAPRTIAFFIFR